MELDLWTILFLCVAFLTGGILKGAMGIGLPAYLVGLLTFVFEPRLALAIIIITIVATNARQAWVGQPMITVLKHLKIYALFGMVSIFIVAYFGALAPVAMLLVAVGVGMVIFSLTSLFAKVPEIPKKWDTTAQAVGGISSGILGGLTGIWGPPLAIYLMTKKLDKDVLIQSLGVIFFIMGLPLAAGLIASGELDLQISLIGTALLIPTFVGMYIGENLRSKMDLTTFIKVFLYIFLLLGLNLIRRGIWA